MAGLASRREKQKFSGMAADWKNFVRDWNRYMEMVRLVEGEVPHEVVLFELLWDALDGASRYQLQARREEEPHLSFEAF